MELSEHMQKSGKVDSSGQPYTKIQRTLSGGVDHVRGTVISTLEMPCHSPTTFRLSSLMSRESITWGHFRSQKIVSISWLQSTTCPNG
jgi:hypothetical protein